MGLGSKVFCFFGFGFGCLPVLAVQRARSGAGVWGLGFGLWGFGFGVWSLGCRVWGLVFRV